MLFSSFWKREKQMHNSSCANGFSIATAVTAADDVVEEHINMPTIRLAEMIDDETCFCSPWRVRMESNFNHQTMTDTITMTDNRQDNASAQHDVEASIVAIPVNLADVYFDNDDDALESTTSNILTHDRRAAYISATAFDCGMRGKRRGVGLEIRCVRGRLLITAVKEGVFADSPLRVGDQLISINNKNVDNIIGGGQATRILNNLQGIVSVVVKTGGDCELIECMIAKPNSGCNAGLRLQYMEQNIHILALDPLGVWSLSLLTEGNRILTINGTPCTQLDGPTAETLINSSERTVSIVAKSVKETSVVVEEQPTNDSYPRLRIHGARRINAEPGWKGNSWSYLGPCFQTAWSPAKFLHISANILAVVLPILVCITFGIGTLTLMTSLIMGLLIVNLPWIGWVDRNFVLFSVGQVLSTILVLVCCAVLLPVYYNDDVVVSLVRNIGLSIPLTVLSNMPMVFTNDNVEHYEIQINADGLVSVAGEDSQDTSDTAALESTV